MRELDRHPGPFALPVPDEWELWLEQKRLAERACLLDGRNDGLWRREAELLARERALASGSDTPDQPSVTRHRDPEAPDPVALLTAAVASLKVEASAALLGQVALDRARSTQVALHDLTVLSLAQLADIDDRRLHTLEGAPSTHAWAERLPADVARQHLTLARRLSPFSQVSGALRAGSITLDGAQAVCQTLTRIDRFLDRPDGMLDGQPQDQALYNVITSGVRQLICRSRGGWDPGGPTSDGDDALPTLVRELHDIAEDPAHSPREQLEAALLVLCRDVPAAHLRPALVVLAHALLPLQLEKAALAGLASRQLRLDRRSDGLGFRLAGHLDLLTGELLFTALEARLATDLDNPDDTRAAKALREQGLDPHDPDLGTDLRPRSTGERLHDALRGALTQLLEGGLTGQRGKARPHLSITVPVESLVTQPGALPAEASAGRCWPGSLVSHLLPDVAVTRFVLGLRGNVLAASHTSRTATRVERLATTVTTGGWCQVDGCTRHTSHLGSTFHHHHLDPWALTGSTSPATNALLCSGDHATLHGGTTLRLRDGRDAGPHGWSPPGYDPHPPPPF